MEQGASPSAQGPEEPKSDLGQRCEAEGGERQASEEEQKRAAIRQQAEADLAMFHERRRREIEERRQQNRKRAEGATSEAEAQAIQGALAGEASTGGAVGALLQAVMSNPSAAAAVQQAVAAAGSGAALPLRVNELLAALPQSAAAAPSAPLAPVTPSGPSQFALRVREAGSASFRRVVVGRAAPEAADGGPSAEREGGGDGCKSPSFTEVECSVCAKFRSVRGPDGSEVGSRRLVTLVRIGDCLEVADDEDVALLQDGDELEATFAAL
uniref:Uncharacterized protein n=1 Tax=Alexandrium monilatum TaxID=311494 RepID=A0A7S4SQN1_9DINO|mmetsp:Transcript_75109/g.223883  ORF Transcript_75109/g.223883 Transcript_75109/m.223883 type:complete len:269 (+) Transcript_75109:86-892(+)